MDNERNDGLHPRHPGKGRCSLIELEGTERVEQGGFMIFLPSGSTKVVGWDTPKPITPTLDAAKDYVTAVIQSLLEQGGPDHPDIHVTNWTSVCAAVQRIILDFNTKVTKAINTKMSRDLMLPSEKRWLQ
jgi:hypothetical protein